MAAPAKPTNNFTQDIQESSAILIVVKDRFLAIASGSHMIKCARILDAQRPGHAVDNKRGIDAMLDLTPSPFAGDGTEAMELLHKHDFELDVTPDSSKLQAGFQPVR